MTALTEISLSFEIFGCVPKIIVDRPHARGAAIDVDGIAGQQVVEAMIRIDLKDWLADFIDPITQDHIDAPVPWNCRKREAIALAT